MTDTQSDFFDLNTAGEQRERDLIPANTIVMLQLMIVPGNAGPGGWLTKSQKSDSEGLALEFTVVDGKYAKKKIWERWTVEGTTAGHAEAKEISRNKLRAVVESARGIRPDDKSETANAGRRLSGGYADLDQIRFVARIGIKPPEGQYQAKNRIDEIITPERQGWQKPEQVTAKTMTGGAAPAPTSSSPPANAITRPQWAS
jgi:hypothetical protein